MGRVIIGVLGILLMACAVYAETSKTKNVEFTSYEILKMVDKGEACNAKGLTVAAVDCYQNLYRDYRGNDVAEALVDQMMTNDVVQMAIYKRLTNIESIGKYNITWESVSPMDGSSSLITLKWGEGVSISYSVIHSTGDVKVTASNGFLTIKSSVMLKGNKSKLVDNNTGMIPFLNWYLKQTLSIPAVKNLIEKSGKDAQRDIALSAMTVLYDAITSSQKANIDVVDMWIAAYNIQAERGYFFAKRNNKSVDTYRINLD